MTNRIARLSHPFGFGAKMKRQFAYYTQRWGKTRGVVKMLKYFDLAF